MKHLRLLSCILVTLFATSFSSIAGAQSAAVPQINQPLVPASVTPGAATFTLQVSGTGFVSGAQVRWNGAALATTFVSSHQLNAPVPAADVASIQTGDITVTNPGVLTPSNVVYLPVVSPFTQITALRQDYSVGNSTAVVGVGDFDGDGIPDLVAASAGLNDKSFLTFLRGYGDGTFQVETTTYLTGEFPLGIVVADFNGDGKLDVAFADSNDGTVSVLLGNGDGTFQTKQLYSVGTFFTEGIAAGDFNHEGKLDLVSCNDSDNSLGILLGNGDGTFQPSVSIPVGVAPWHVVTGDFNRDGNLDIAFISSAASSVSIMLGNGDGTFGLPVPYGVIFPNDLVTADFNGDGILDLAIVSDNLNGMLTILLGNGDGTFGPPMTRSTLNEAQEVVTGDFNGDGKLDLAVQTFNCTPNCDQGGLAVLLGNGDGTFESSSAFGTVSLGSWVATGDFNNDGKADFAVGVFYGGDIITTLLQTPAVSVSPAVVTFARQLVGTTGTRNVKLTNNTANTITITAITVSAAGFSETDTCGALPAQLAPGKGCTITVLFTPSTFGAFAGTVTITDNGGTGTQTIRLSGGAFEPIATYTTTALSFPPTPVGQTSAPMTVGLTNNGNVNLRIGSIGFTEGTGGFNESNNCGSALVPNSSCGITVTFTPQATGPVHASIKVETDARPPDQTLLLFGTGQ